MTGGTGGSGLIPCHGDSGPSHARNIAAAEVDSVVDPTGVSGMDGGSGGQRKFGERVVERGWALLDFENEGAARIVTLTLAEAFVSAMELEALAKGGSEEASGGGVAPRNEIGDFRRRSSDAAVRSDAGTYRFECAL